MILTRTESPYWRDMVLVDDLCPYNWCGDEIQVVSGRRKRVTNLRCSTIENIFKLYLAVYLEYWAFCAYNKGIARDTTYGMLSATGNTLYSETIAKAVKPTILNLYV